jgi:pimeloyl-ACP methyl ester carboxylesterase
MQDRAAPPSVGRYFERVIPGCRARYFPGEGHFLHHEHWEEILATLVP